MKASVLCANEDLRYMDVEEPTMDNESVKIKIFYTGICKSDVPRVLKNTAHSYPIILGHEFSGEVIEIGKDVKNVKIGDHVVGIPLKPCFKCEDCKKGNYSLCKNYTFYGSRKNGSYAEKIVLPETNVFKISNEIDFKHAAFFEPMTIAYHALKQAKFEPNKTVGVLGNGTIGLFTMQLAKIMGASKVVMIGRNKEKLQVAKNLGADECISTLDYNFKDIISDITDGKNFDYLIETAGSTETIKLSYSLVANKGTVCLVGTPTKEVTFTVSEWEQLNRREFYLTGSWMSYSAPFPGEEWKMCEKFLMTKQLKIVDDMIYKIYDLENVDLAFQDFKNGKVVGRTLIKCNKD